MRFPRRLLTTGVAVLISGCGGMAENESEGFPKEEGVVQVTLSPQAPDPETGQGLRWSPYGKQLPLTEVDGGMNAQLLLGVEGTPAVALRLVKGPEADHFDHLYVDRNRDGEFDETELHQMAVTERNFKFWSSYDAVLEIPITDPESGAAAVNPYPLSFWYVEDPRIPDEEPVIRFSRRGWMEGAVALDGIDAVMLVTENVMDGVFGQGDSWALAPRDSVADILSAGSSRGMDEHAWLFERAYRVTEIDPSGRRLSLAPFDPGITRAEEIEMNDHLAVDREAARSGRTVAFLHDFAEAEALARAEGRPLLIDFETTWCGPCKIMDEWVYTADDVVDASRSVVAVKVDGDERLDLKDRFGVSGFPTMILLGPDGEEIKRAAGYVSVAGMTEFLELSK